MKGMPILLAAVLLSVGFAAAEPGVVSVSATYQGHDEAMPWRMGRPSVRYGYAVRVGKNTFLTTESLVRNHRLIELSKARTAQKMAARVLLSDEHVNLALLSVDKIGALADLELFGPIDKLAPKAELEVLQFDGNRQLQRGMGRMLRVGMERLPDAPYRSLTMQLLTDVNVNGQGAPMLCGGKLAGLVMAYDKSTRTGAVVPFPVLQRFLEDALREPYQGIAAAGFVSAVLVDPAKRAFLGVKKPDVGFAVVMCHPQSGAAAALKPNDVIMEWDGHTVDNLGYYNDPEFGRLDFSYLIKGRRRPGDRISASVIRDKQVKPVEVLLTAFRDGHNLIPDDPTARQPDYLVTGGLVLRECTGRFLNAYGDNWRNSAPARLVHLHDTRRLRPERPGDRVVIISQILRDPINIGYEYFIGRVVEGANGQPIRNLGDVFRIQDESGPITRLKLARLEVEIAFDAAQLPEAHKRLSRAYGIPALRRRID